MHWSSASKFGNMQKIAEGIAQALEPAGSVRALSLDQLTVSDMEDADLVVMGSPTHRMNLSEEVRSVFETLTKRILRGTSAAAFGSDGPLPTVSVDFTTGIWRILPFVGIVMFETRLANPDKESVKREMQSQLLAFSGLQASSGILASCQ